MEDAVHSQGLSGTNYIQHMGLHGGGQSGSRICITPGSKTTGVIKVRTGSMCYLQQEPAQPGGSSSAGIPLTKRPPEARTQKPGPPPAQTAILKFIPALERERTP